MESKKFEARLEVQIAGAGQMLLVVGGSSREDLLNGLKAAITEVVEHLLPADTAEQPIRLTGPVDLILDESQGYEECSTDGVKMTLETTFPESAVGAKDDCEKEDGVVVDPFYGHWVSKSKHW